LQLLLAPFSKMPESLVSFVIAIGIAGLMVVIFVKAASTAEGRPSLFNRWIKRPNTKILFVILLVGWVVVFGAALTLVPHEGASSPYGGLALIAMFTGFFNMMGFLWSVIGE
jgi:membrane protease YdiL (CAAX protease family)